jgi:hypothetical protein
MKHIKLFEQFINEGYLDNFEKYEKEFKLRGFKRHNEEWSSGGYEDMWYIDYTLGRLVVSFSGDHLAVNSRSTMDKHQSYGYGIFFEPFPKFKKKLFGLIKTKKVLQWGKQVSYKSGSIDFGEGLFKVDDNKFIKKLFKEVDDAIDKASQIDNVDFESPEKTTYTVHSAITDIDRNVKY